MTSSTNKKTFITRRKVLSCIGAAAGLTMLSSGIDKPKQKANIVTSSTDRKDIRDKIYDKVSETVLIDTHEHLPDESERLSSNPPLNIVNDWSTLFSHYLNSDLRSAGMTAKDLKLFLGKEADPLEKWKLLEPWWPAVKHTGYGQATAIAIRELYGIDIINKNTISKLQNEFERLLKPGLYDYVLKEKAGIESCQVNSLTDSLITETDMPLLLMQDLRIDNFFAWINVEDFARRAGIKVNDLQDWYKVILIIFLKNTGLMQLV